MADASPPPPVYFRQTELVKAFIYCSSTLVLSLLVHFTANKVDRFLRRAGRSSVFQFMAENADMIRSYMPVLKTIAFLFAILVLCMPLLISTYKSLRLSKVSSVANIAGYAILVSILLSALSFRSGTDSMGTNYAIIARDPFMQNTSSHSTRLLMPALAYIFLLRDFQHYYLFSATLTITFIALLYYWTKDHAPLKMWQLVSLCTCSFVLFQYQYGGYPDILVFVCYILVMLKSTSQEARLSLLILAFFAHESSIFIGILLALRYLQRKELIVYLVSIMIYGIVWLWVSDWSIQTVLGSHPVKGKSGLEWVFTSPTKELIGIIISYKVLWLAVIAGCWVSFKKHLYQDTIFILACAFAGVFMTLLGVDTSRLMGFAFPGALIAISVLQHQMKPQYAKPFLATVFLLNLVIPSFNIGLNGWIEFFPGLYKFIYGWLGII